MPNNYKIYYFTHVALHDKSSPARKMTSVFNVPFYCSSGDNSGAKDTWFPFLGMQPFDNTTETVIQQPSQMHPFFFGMLIPGQRIVQKKGIERGWFRKPGFMNIANLEVIPTDIIQQFTLSGDDIYKRFTTVKGMLISAALGGGIWETEQGLALLQELKTRYPVFFDNYSFSIVDSHKVFNQQIHGILTDTRRGVEFLVNVNKFLEGKTGKDLSFNFAEQNWVEPLNDLSLLLTPNNTPCTLKSWQSTIDEYFPKIFPKFADQLDPVKYDTLHTPTAEILDELNLTMDEYPELLVFIKSHYDEELRKYRETTDPLVLTFDRNFYRTYPIPNTGKSIEIAFLNNGHIIVFSYQKRKVLRDTQTSLIFRSYCVTMGQQVAIKISSALMTNVIPSLLAVSCNPHIIKIIGITTDRLSNGNFCNGLVTPIYDCTLLEAINANKLSFTAREMIFKQLLAAVAGIHKVPILFGGKQQAKMFHGDLKVQNVFLKLSDGINLGTTPTLKANDFELVLADIDTAGTFETYWYTNGYVSPELARSILAFKHGFNKVFLLEHNIEFAKAYDIWALGITLAKVLQENNSPHSFNFHAAALNFMLQCQGESETHLNAIASLQQGDIDAELNIIKAACPNTYEGRKLRDMWDLVHSMLQVLPENRPSIFDLSKRFNLNENKSPPELRFVQKKMTDFYPQGEKKRQRTLEECFAKMKLGTN